MGDNRWLELDTWPPPAQTVPFYLAPNGKLDTRPDGRKNVDRFTADPRRPVPSLGGALCCSFTLQPWGPADQRPLDVRDDVLHFTSAPLPRDLRVLGEVLLEAEVATSVPDADFAAKLVDVREDGAATLVTDGLLRLRYRSGLERAAVYRPGESVAISISLGVTARAFPAHHRLRVDIAGSNFPRFDRNPNTGREIAGETELRVARSEIHLGGKSPSRLLLPTIPAGAPAHRRLE
jgi:hypothetical protein